MPNTMYLALLERYMKDGGERSTCALSFQPCWRALGDNTAAEIIEDAKRKPPHCGRYWI